MKPLSNILAAASLLAALVGCADELPGVVWANSESVALAPGKDFTQCTAAAVAGVPGLVTRESAEMKPYFDGYLVLGGPEIEKLRDVNGDVRLHGTTIQVEFSSAHRKQPEDAVRDAADRLLAELRTRVASQCS